MSGLQADAATFEADVNLQGETWISRDDDTDRFKFRIQGYNIHLNSVGKVKGFAIFIR